MYGIILQGIVSHHPRCNLHKGCLNILYNMFHFPYINIADSYTAFLRLKIQLAKYIFFIKGCQYL